MTLSQSTTELDAETRADVRAMIDEGLLPSEISRELDVPIKAVEGMRREYLRKKKQDAAVLGSAGIAQSLVPDPGTAALQLQIAEMERAIQKEMLQDQYDHLKRKRALDLEERELNLRRKRYELREDYEMEDDAEEGVDRDVHNENIDGTSSGSMDLDFDFDSRPLESAAKLISVLKGKADTNVRQAQVQTMNTPDPTKPMTDAEIDSILSTLNSIQIAGLKAMKDEEREKTIVQYLPSALPENIKRAVSRIRHYER